MDLCFELVACTDTAAIHDRASRMCVLLESFVHDWRQLCALYGSDGKGKLEFRRLARAVHHAAKPLAEGLVMRSNGVRALHVLEARVLKHLVAEDGVPEIVVRRERLLEQPLFIVAAPRSGSKLLFETLACSSAFNTFGGEAHRLIESLEGLRPGAPGVESNRLTALQATREDNLRVASRLAGRLVALAAAAVADVRIERPMVRSARHACRSTELRASFRR